MTCRTLKKNGRQCGRTFDTMSELRSHAWKAHPEQYTARFHKKNSTNGKETRKVPVIDGDIQVVENTPREALRIQLTAKRDRYDAMLKELEDL